MDLSVLGICEDLRTRWRREGLTCAADLGGGQRLCLGMTYS